MNSDRNLGDLTGWEVVGVALVAGVLYCLVIGLVWLVALVWG